MTFLGKGARAMAGFADIAVIVLLLLWSGLRVAVRESRLKAKLGADYEGPLGGWEP